jgi:PKD repeat protein
MRLIAPDGIVYGPDGAGPIAGYALSDSTEIYEIANPAPGEWQIEFTSLALPIDGSEIVLSISILEVAEPKFTQAPVAILSGDVEGYAWQEIMLSGAESFDYDGTIVKYEWDVDDDGIFDYTTAAPQVSHRYKSAYSGKILLRVTDNDGLSSQDTASATIQLPRLFLPTIWN